MNPKSTIKPRQLLTLLLLVFIPLPSMIHNYPLFLLSCFLSFIIAIAYPIISAIIFCDNNIFIWVAPAMYTVMTIIVTLWIYVWSGGPAGDQFLFLLPFLCLIAIGWSVMWTLIVKKARKKSS